MERSDQILDYQKIIRIVKRLSFQIFEKNHNQSEIFLIGIYKNGYNLSKLIQQELQKISDKKIHLCCLKINKKEPLKKIEFDTDLSKINNKAIVLIDDVLNSGKTLIYCTKFLLDVPISNFNTAVLIDRNHKKFPIKVDFKGISISTSIDENINVIFETDNIYAFIN